MWNCTGAIALSVLPCLSMIPPAWGHLALNKQSLTLHRQVPLCPRNESGDTQDGLTSTLALQKGPCTHLGILSSLNCENKPGSLPFA